MGKGDSFRIELSNAGSGTTDLKDVKRQSTNKSNFKRQSTKPIQMRNSKKNMLASKVKKSKKSAPAKSRNSSHGSPSLTISDISLDSKKNEENDKSSALP